MLTVLEPMDIIVTLGRSIHDETMSVPFFSCTHSRSLCFTSSSSLDGGFNRRSSFAHLVAIFSNKRQMQLLL